MNVLSALIFSLQLTRCLEDVQDGTDNLRLDLATAEDLLLAANAVCFHSIFVVPSV
jgi:hypothetical protein